MPPKNPQPGPNQEPLFDISAPQLPEQPIEEVDSRPQQPYKPYNPWDEDPANQGWPEDEYKGPGKEAIEAAKRKLKKNPGPGRF